MRLGIDAMGGDYAPEVVVLGALSASGKLKCGQTIVLFGDKHQIDLLFDKNGGKPENIEVVNTTQVISMGDAPAQAFKEKQDSSIVVGFMHLKKGMIDGFASAGSTGAMMVGCMFVSKQIDGIIRPTIGTVLATANNKKVVLLDIGLNVDCKPEVLSQYGLIGSVYCKQLLGIENPRIGLLNIGEEREKGNNQTKLTIPMMEEQTQYNFVGNVESKYLFSGEFADVFVCDGFTGNVILKMCEGIYSVADPALRNNDQVIRGFNYELEGGTPVLGVNHCVIIGHGCSTPLAIENMILQTAKTIENKLVERLKEEFSKI